jgi:hypothetical protein
LCVFSFDYIQPRQGDQGRKTRFFRRLYGQTQLVNRRLRDGRTVSYTYHYPGVLAELPHVKLGRSVFGVRPGTEGSVLDLFESFEEVAFYRFTGWLPVRMWQLANRKPLIVTSSLIARFGYLSVLLTTAWRGGSVSNADLVDSGFDAEYIAAASNYLQKHGLLGSKPEVFYCTARGRALVQTLLPVVERNGTI